MGLSPQYLSTGLQVLGFVEPVNYLVHSDEVGACVTSVTEMFVIDTPILMAVVVPDNGVAVGGSEM